MTMRLSEIVMEAIQRDSELQLHGTRMILRLHSWTTRNHEDLKAPGCVEHVVWVVVSNE